MEQTDALAALRDIHVPAPPPGLSMLPVVTAGVGVVLAALLIMFAVIRVRRRWAVDLQAALAALEPADDGALLEASKLLRRAAIAAQGPAIRKLSGPSWQAELDRLLRTDFFTAGAGRFFGAQQYEKASPVDAPALLEKLRHLAAVRSWSP